MNVKVFLSPDGPGTCSIVGSVTATVYGTGGLNDRVKITGDAVMNVDGNVDTIYLPLASTAYTFYTRGNQLYIEAAGVLKCWSQGWGNNDRKIVFANGSVPWTRTGLNQFIGGVQPPAAPAAGTTLAFTVDSSENYSTAGF